ncbi:FliM/FliN family flagellar motor C-terminal domain-containing protein [Rhodobacteraceae bacterium M382]|nr:FliM/FliN family flagellar motor C-terminal domain-containing protein [Rhodobacteraceae bacterium M382]
MTDTADNDTGHDATETVLRRKLSAGRPAEEPSGDSRAILRAVRRALARAAEDLYDLPLAVIGAKQALCAPDGLSGCLADGQLLLLLDGPDGCPGAIAMDGAAVTAAIQQQTMGQVSGPSSVARNYTGTDAAMIAPLIDAMLTRAERNLGESPDLHQIRGFRFGARVDDVRSLSLMLEAERYLVFELTLDLAVGRTQGHMCLILPDMPDLPEEETASDAQQDVADLSGSAGVVRAELSAVLTRMQLSLEDLMALKPGKVLPLAAATLNGTEITGIDGSTVAFGRLGQAAGARAVRLHATGRRRIVRDADPGEFAAHIGPVDLPGHSGTSADGAEAPQQHSANKVVTIETAQEASVHSEVEGTIGDTLNAPMDTAEDFSVLTPEQVAAEISELAGLEGVSPNG